MAFIQFGPEQLRAIQMAKEWIKTPPKSRSPVFVIAGYAGTGKSTVLSHILDEMNIPKYSVAFATYTGKAAVILRQKGLNAFTIHHLMYQVYKNAIGKLSFRKKTKLPSSIELIAIDEIGMVPEQIMEDMIAYGVPILGLGDNGQLPPIYGENRYITNPQITLTQVYRHALDSGVLRLATDIRNGIFSTCKKYGNDVTFITKKELKVQTLLTYDQVLCATNTSRIGLNTTMRRLLKYKSKLPCKGDKIICVANNFKEVVAYYDDLEYFMVNGLTGKCVDDCYDIGIGDALQLEVLLDGIAGESVQIYCTSKPFSNTYEEIGESIKRSKDLGQSELEEFEGRLLNKIEYGWAITVHKSQGSQWNSILVYDDCFYRSDPDYLRWMYTAVTRAQTKVAIVCENR